MINVKGESKQSGIKLSQHTESPQVPTRTKASVGPPFWGGFECSTSSVVMYFDYGILSPGFLTEGTGWRLWQRLPYHNRVSAVIEAKTD